MRVAMYYNNNNVRIEDIPKPVIGEKEILVKVIASGICGSDVLEWYRIKKAPLVLGHEITGEVVEAGSKVSAYKKGHRVFVSHHIPCNTCRYCLSLNHTACETLHTTNYYPGGFSEYIRVPELNVDRGVFILPDEISYENGTFIEPLACVARGQRVANFKPGQTVLVLGSGISGLLHILLAKKMGAEKIIATDINSYRLDAALNCGADLSIDASEDVPDAVKRVNNGRLADLVIICTGQKSAFMQALKSVDRTGTVLCFAAPEPGIDIPVPINEFWRNSVTLLTSYGNSPEDADIAISLLKTKSIDVSKLITDVLSLNDVPLGFKLVAKPGKSIKVIIKPHLGNDAEK